MAPVTPTVPTWSEPAAYYVSGCVIYIPATSFDVAPPQVFLEPPADWRTLRARALQALRAALDRFWGEPTAPRPAAPVPAKLRDWQAAAKGLR